MFEENRLIIITPSLSKKFDFKVRSLENEKPAFSNSSGLKSVFQTEFRIRDRLLWTGGLTVELKLRFPPGVSWTYAEKLHFLLIRFFLFLFKILTSKSHTIVFSNKGIFLLSDLLWPKLTFCMGYESFPVVLTLPSPYNRCKLFMRLHFHCFTRHAIPAFSVRSTTGIP